MLGDKFLEEKNQNIRQNNFDEFREITEQNLLDSSKNYKVRKISSNTYLLQQTVSYTDARTFNVILKIKNTKVDKFYVLNDYIIKQFQEHDGYLYLFADDMLNLNSFWKSKNGISIVKLDSDLNEVWNYQANNSVLPMQIDIHRTNQNHLEAWVQFINGCGLCFNNVLIYLDESGKCIKAIYKGKDHAYFDLTQSFIDSTFIIN